MRGEPVRFTGWSYDRCNGCLTGLDTEVGHIAVPSWGTEFGDWIGTFAQYRMAGRACRILRCDVRESSPRELVTRIEVALPTGRLRFVGVDRLEEMVLRRDYRLEAVDQEAAVGDFVVRASFSGPQWPRGAIANRHLVWAGRNRLQQHPVTTASLEGRNLHLRSEIIDVAALPGMDVVSYLRDEPGQRWVLHHRLITMEQGSDEYVFRLGGRVWSSRQYPIVGNRLFRRLLWRWSERHWNWRLPTIQVCGNVRLAPSQRCTITTELSLVQHTRS